MKYSEFVLLAALLAHFYVRFGLSLVVTVQDVCNKFPDNLRPILCILQDNELVPKTSTTTGKPSSWGTTPGYHGGGWGWGWGPNGEESSSEEDDAPFCTCDLACYPPPTSSSSEEITDYRCKACGNNCDVKTVATPTCDCAVLGASGPVRRQDCSCTVTCAKNPWQDELPFCIFNVTQVRGSSMSPRPVDCECCKSKAAESNRNPDFVCICQRL